MTAQEIEQVIRGYGWYLVRIHGSHHHYKHPTKKGCVTIPFHTQPKDLPKKTISSILKQADIKKSELKQAGRK